MPTHRSEIQYRITRTGEQTINNNMLSTALSSSLQNHERGIIFVLTIVCCKELAAMSGFPAYHGQLTDEDRSAAMLTWQTGKSQWIIGMLAMAQGIDVSSVRVIINREIAWVGAGGASKVLNLVHFAQMSRRAGRDGKRSVHHLLYSSTPCVDIRASDDHGGQQAMINFHTLTHQQQFYSSPTGSRLKTQLQHAEPATPVHTISSGSRLAALALPTPTSRPMIAHPCQTPLTPTPFSKPVAEDSESSCTAGARNPAAAGPSRSGQHHSAPPKPPSLYYHGATAQPPAPMSQRRDNPPPISCQDPDAAPSLDGGLRLTLEDKVATIGRWCERSVNKCSICMFFNTDCQHLPYRCPSAILQSVMYQTYRAGLRFTLHGFCYACIVPDNVHKNHKRPNPKSRFLCLYDDQLRPLPYLIYMHKPMQKAMFNAMGMNPKQFINMDAFARWLGEEEPHRDAMPNIQELICVYIKLKLNDALPSVSLAPQ
ncbi:hypothetical protein BDR03DRAFT_1016300 [Suillus americanus]|nr:hypothetical protein BDR03DRAFT_1016300 [Suillus americanus]